MDSHPAPPVTTPQAAVRPMVVAMIVACALFMENLDGTVISTALPAMARSFGTSPIRLSVAITAYMLSLAVFIPASGWVADRFGARRVFCAAIVVFTFGSALCGLSEGLTSLTIARVIQGTGGAMMVPVGRLVLLRSVPKSELVQAMAYFTVPALIGPILGPPLGGFITTYFAWPWIFYLNLPIGLIGFALALRFVEDHREAQIRRFDGIGFGLCGAALSSLLWGLELLSRDGLTSAAVWLGAGICLGVLAILHARRHPQPILDLSLLGIPSFAISLWGGSLFRIGIGALPFLLPLMLQVGFGMDAFVSGSLTFAAAAGALLMKITARPILRRLGFRRALFLNWIVSALSIGGCALFRPSTPGLVILVILLVGGFFRSLQFTGLNTLAYADVPTERMSAATSFVSMLQQVALAAGVALGALMLNLIMSARGQALGSLAAADFPPAFAAIVFLCVASSVFFLWLDPAAGAEVSGHRPRVAQP